MDDISHLTDLELDDLDAIEEYLGLDTVQA